MWAVDLDIYFTGYLRPPLARASILPNHVEPNRFVHVLKVKGHFLKQRKYSLNERTFTEYRRVLCLVLNQRQRPQEMTSQCQSCNLWHFLRPLQKSNFWHKVLLPYMEHVCQYSIILNSTFLRTVRWLFSVAQKVGSPLQHRKLALLCDTERWLPTVAQKVYSSLQVSNLTSLYNSAI